MSKFNSNLTVERVRELFNYDFDTGVLTRKVNTFGRGRAGDVAGYTNKDGYLSVRIDYVLYALHRVAWLHHWGVWPANILDHKDRNPSNNRISNLQDVTRTWNQQNRGANRKGSSPFKGVFWHKASLKWEAQIGVAGKRIHLGLFTNEKEAGEAYLRAAKTYHPNSNPANI